MNKRIIVSWAVTIVYCTTVSIIPLTFVFGIVFNRMLEDSTLRQIKNSNPHVVLLRWRDAVRDSAARSSPNHESLLSLIPSDVQPEVAARLHVLELNQQVVLCYMESGKILELDLSLIKIV